MTENHWPTKEHDLEIADEIMQRYQETYGKKLGLLEVVVDKKNDKLIDIRIPEWIQEVINYFRKHYGYEEGQVIASKVMTRILLRNETVH